MPLVITDKLGNCIVKRILVVMGIESNILFRNAFDAMGLKDQHLKPHLPRIFELGDYYIKPDGVVDLFFAVGEGVNVSVVQA